MGGHVDHFVVRLVLAITLVSWASVLGHDVLDREPAESIEPAATRAEPDAPPSVVPVNVTPVEERPRTLADAVPIP